VAAGALEGLAPDDVEILALDWTAITVGRFLSARHEGNPGRARVEIGIARMTASDGSRPVPRPSAIWRSP
jgi:hypothetical protein